MSATSLDTSSRSKVIVVQSAQKDTEAPQQYEFEVNVELEENGS